MGPMDQMSVCRRNPVWIERLSRLEDGRTHFVAVGAAHLANFDINDIRGCACPQRQLKAKGLTVEAVGN